jgi:hypothetical protein
MAKTATRPKEANIASWQPEGCEACQYPFTEAWELDWSLSGKQVWICPCCKHMNYPRLD